MHTIAFSYSPIVAMLRHRYPTFGLLTLLVFGLCTNSVESSPSSGRNASTTTRIQQCREGCLEKFAIKESLCQKRPECSACWDECTKPPPPKINKSIRETWALRTVSMLQQDSLVLVDVAWTPLNTPNQCLVTWEVSGGGLMGNLLTESFNVQLSLWPDTKYRVQVTCKNKLTGGMSRSLPLTIDTSEAVTTQDHSQPQLQKQFFTTLLPSKVQQKSQLLSSNSIQDTISTSSVASEAAAPPPPLPAAPGGIPFDDVSAESMNQHTNSIFNWHTKNSDISKIEPISKPDLNILKIATLSDMQKPLVFGVITGSFLLVIILFLYVCMLRSQRVPSDKTALIEDDSSSVIVSMPQTSSSSLDSSTSAWTPITSAAVYGASRTGDLCKNSGTCSRNALKV